MIEIIVFQFPIVCSKTPRIAWTNPLLVGCRVCSSTIMIVTRNPTTVTESIPIIVWWRVQSSWIDIVKVVIVIANVQLILVIVNSRVWSNMMEIVVFQFLIVCSTQLKNAWLNPLLVHCRVWSSTIMFVTRNQMTITGSIPIMVYWRVQSNWIDVVQIVVVVANVPLFPVIVNSRV